MTIRELAERIKAKTGSRSEIVTIPYDEAYEAGFEDMPRRVPDLTKIHKAIGYVPKVAARRDHRAGGRREAQPTPAPTAPCADSLRQPAALAFTH